MAPASRPFSIIIVLLLCVHLSSRSSIVRGDDERHEAAARARSPTQPGVCSDSKVPSNSFKVVHRFGPCVHRPPPASGANPSDDYISTNNIAGTYRRDARRVAYLKKRMRLIAKWAGPNYYTSTSSSSNPLSPPPPQQVTLPARDAITVGSGNYAVTLGIGTPARGQTVIFDTGSSLSWVQCEPCHPCFRQRERTFNPSLSRTYTPVRCSEPACARLPASVRGCVNNVCTYNLTYEDGDSTAGFLGRDLLTLSPAPPNQFPGFVFGCGHQNVVAFEGIAGVFGLGRSFHSLVTQTSGRYGDAFSYCLPSTVTGVGYLTLGRRAAPSPSYTPMLLNARAPNVYLIDLMGISVDDRRLPVSPTVFRAAGTIIDSGVGYSRLPQEAYTALRTAFRVGMSRYGYQQVPGVDILDTCYNIGRRGINFPCPNVTLHFTGATVNLKREQVLEPPSLNSTSTYCLAFASTPRGDYGFIGNLQQRGMEVIFDIGGQRIGFSRGTRCT